MRVRHRVALDQGFDVVATGHNLDREAATLLGNTRLRYNMRLRYKEAMPVKVYGPG